MDWFKGKFTGKPHIYWENLWFPVDFPLNQSIEDKDSVDLIRVFQHLPMSTVLLFKVHFASQVGLPVPKRLHLA